LNNETARDWKYSLDYEDVRSYQADLTISEILDYTPDIEHLINRILIRNATTSKLLNFSGPEAFERLKIVKYIHLEFVCYSIEVLNHASQLYKKLSLMPMYSGLLLEVKFSKLFDRSNIFKVMIHEGLPYRPIQTTDTITTGYNETLGTYLFSMFEANGYRLFRFSLPPPYVTQCMRLSKLWSEK